MTVTTSLQANASYSQTTISPAPTDIELDPRAEGIEPLDTHQSFSLPPTDEGKDAWLCLFACFMLEALIWGKPLPGRLTFDTS